MTQDKLILLIKENNPMPSLDDEEMVVHAHYQFEVDNKIYVPVVKDEQTTICRVDIINGQQMLTDDLTDAEYQRVQVIYNSMQVQHG